MNLMLLARKTSLEMIGEVGSTKEALVQHALELVARRCEEIAMERCRLLNSDAMAMRRKGRHDMAESAEMKADQFVWMAAAICREFGLEKPR